MNRYKFRLETVLRYRRILEDNRKRDLADALNALQNEQDAYSSIEQEISEQDKRAAAAKHGPVRARDLISHSNYARHLDRRQKNQAIKIKNAGIVVDGKRSELSEAMKKRKILDRLKEQGRENHERAAAKEEQSMVDDLTIQHYTGEQD